MFITFYIIAVALLLCGATLQRTGIYSDYIDKKECNCIKGFFIILVFVHHLWPYLDNAGYSFTGFCDGVFRWIDETLAQLIVVMFLFYSGYGVMESYKRKGIQYVNTMPKKRLLTTLLNFDVAVSIFLIADIFIGRKYPISDIILSFTGWTSVGNSNWYICVILMCYLTTYAVLKIAGKLTSFQKIFLITCIISVVFVILIIAKDGYWFDTIYAFPFGVFYSIYKEQIEKIVEKRFFLYLLLSVVMYLFWQNFPYSLHGVFGNVKAISFAIMVVLITMKLRLNSNILEMLGKNIFPLYIYQRLGMNVLSSVYDGIIVREYPGGYVMLCVIITLLLAVFYKKIQIKIE